MVNKIVRTFTPQTFFFCEETDIKLAPGDGKQIDEGGTVGDSGGAWLGLKHQRTVSGQCQLAES